MVAEVDTAGMVLALPKSDGEADSVVNDPKVVKGDATTGGVTASAAAPNVKAVVPLTGFVSGLATVEGSEMAPVVGAVEVVIGAGTTGSFFAGTTGT